MRLGCWLHTLMPSLRSNRPRFVTPETNDLFEPKALWNRSMSAIDGGMRFPEHAMINTSVMINPCRNR
jgi:hypothetical protein